VARREFMHVDDLGKAVVHMLMIDNPPMFCNIGWGEDISISQLANKIALTVGYKGELIWDQSKPDGMLKKCLDVSRLKAVGFSPEINLDMGIIKMVNEYRNHKNVD